MLYTTHQIEMTCNDALLIVLTKIAAAWPKFSLSLQTLFHDYVIWFYFHTIQDSSMLMMLMDVGEQPLRGKENDGECNCVHK